MPLTGFARFSHGTVSSFLFSRLRHDSGASLLGLAESRRLSAGQLRFGDRYCCLPLTGFPRTAHGMVSSFLPVGLVTFPARFYLLVLPNLLSHGISLHLFRSRPTGQLDVVRRPLLLLLALDGLSANRPRHGVLPLSLLELMTAGLQLQPSYCLPLTGFARIAHGMASSSFPFSKLMTVGAPAAAPASSCRCPASGALPTAYR